MIEDDIQIKNVVKIDVNDGDVLLVTLPERPMPDSAVQRMADDFEMMFMDKEVNIMFVRHGTKVELIKSSMLDDKS